jgi:2-C-methyl-D-erythritol 4-phosphate cytidylyltransferase
MTPLPPLLPLYHHYIQVRVTRGSYTNIKVTTPDDMSVAEKFLAEAQAAAPAVTSVPVAATPAAAQAA